MSVCAATHAVMPLGPTCRRQKGFSFWREKSAVTPQISRQLCPPPKPKSKIWTYMWAFCLSRTHLSATWVPLPCPHCFGVGGDSPPEFNPLMSLTRGPSHVLAHTWPTYPWQRQSTIQHTYIGQCSSLARCGHAIGPILRGADRVGIYPFNLELKFVTGISPSYLIQIWWLFFLNFSKITLLSSMTFLITHSIS